MEPIHMNELREILYRLRKGESQREIARAMEEAE